MGMSFLTATWSNLINLTYRVPPELLLPRVPPGLSLDVQEGHAFASVVAFDFLDTRVLGVPWPGYRDFPELNLRFYVKHGQTRGVVFIREYVPKALIAKLARALYNEPYEAAPMRSQVRDDGQLITYELSLSVGGREHTLRATGSHPSSTPSPDSTAHYFKEHEWGYGVDRRGRTRAYRVEHPVWQTYPVQSTSVDADFGLLYGPSWSFLNQESPMCAVFAVGSAIKVWPHHEPPTP